MKFVRLRQNPHRSVFATAAGGTVRSCRCTPMVAREKTIETASPMRTPVIMPKRSISTPPRKGAIMIGKRLMTDCIPIPMEWRLASSVSAMSEKVAGKEKQVHERKRNIPQMTAPQCGTNSTTAYPTMERRLKTMNARRNPQRSTTTPPG